MEFCMAQSYSVEPEGVISGPASVSEAAERKVVNWPHVWAYIGLSFGLTWLIDLVIYLNGGLTNPAAKLLMQFMMLMPAFAAIFLGMFFFRESPIYYRTNRTASRWFIYYYFFLTLAFLVVAILVLVQPARDLALSVYLGPLSMIGLLLLLVLRWRGGPQAFAGAGMAGGNWHTWLLYGLGVVLFCALETLLNYVFKLGQPGNPAALYPPGSTASIPPLVLMGSTFFNMVIIGPLLGLIITFGEEYGWRGYLQSELVHLGRIRGVGLLGIIWGIWHWPVIWMGYNYPGQPVLGSLLMVVFTVLLAYFLAYAVFKSKGVWTAAYLHGLFNQTLAFFMLAVFTPASIVWSFSIGIPGLLLAVPVILLILRDPIWKETD
jgi:membrane protease YdiL (CAAX protease family)